MADSTILEIGLMTDGLTGKTGTFNFAIQDLEKAIGDSYNLIISNGDFNFSTGGSPGKAEALAAYRIAVTSSANLTAIRTITFPTNKKPYLIRNLTSANNAAGFSIDVKCLGGSISTRIANGESAYFYCDGTEMIKVGSVKMVGATDPIFGDGSDGDSTVAVTSTPWPRDMFFNRLSLTTAALVRTGNFRIFVKEVLFIAASTVLHSDGTTASGTGASAAIGTGSVGGVPVGGPAGATGAGTAGNNVTGSGIGTPGAAAAPGGGNGGTGNGGANAGGTAGTYTPITAVQGSLRQVRYAVDGRVPSTTSLIHVNTGASGGSGAGDGTAGGGAGSPAGYVVVCARVIVNNGAIRAHGGGGGTPAGGNRGGGGGGQGGIVVLVYQYYSGAGTVTATGGPAGGSTGTGGAAQAGQAGAVYQFVIA